VLESDILCAEMLKNINAFLMQNPKVMAQVPVCNKDQKYVNINLGYEKKIWSGIHWLVSLLMVQHSAAVSGL